MSFLVVVPTRGTLFTEHQEAIEREFREAKEYPAIVRTNGVRLLPARNSLFEAASKVEGWDTLIMLDDDIVLPVGSFKAMKKRLDEGADIAVINYPHHYHPLLSENKPAGVTVFTQWLPGEDLSLREIAWSGLGAVAIKRPVMEKLLKDGFKFKATAHPVQIDDLGRVALTTTHDKGVGSQPDFYSGGEDTDFFFETRKLGLKIRLVPDLIAHHLRLDHAVSWVSEDKYSTTHVIERSEIIEVPGNTLHGSFETHEG